MKIDTININDTIEKAKALMAKEPNLSPALKAVINMLFVIVSMLIGKHTKNSKNSSIPPSQDPNRAKVLTPKDPNKKPGGQPGRTGKNLIPFADPDEIIDMPIDRRTLPKGHTYTPAGVSKRQVVELLLSRHVIEYRLELLKDEKETIYTAPAPEGLSRPIQYGNSVKSMAVYMSMFQLVPYARVEDYFFHQAGIPVSVGSLCNFNEEAFNNLEAFENIAKERLRKASLLNADETGINVGGRKKWLHTASNLLWTLLVPHDKRGQDATKDIDIFPHFKGTAVHDHWTPYFVYKNCLHALCNAHHLRELQAVIETHPTYTWASGIKGLLLDINEAVGKHKGVLPKKEAENYRLLYRAWLAKGNTECPMPDLPPEGKKKKGKIAKSKDRNLLERLINFENETLRFMTNPEVPFTNNQGERDLRMTKVQQKISGCFRSMEGAKIFCRIRSYLLTSQKHGVSPTEALNTLFQGKLPSFCDETF